MSTMKQICWSLLIIAVFTACGKKGQLVPPEALVPAAVENLAARQQGEDFVVTWSAPAREQGGRPLRDLAGFQLLLRRFPQGASSCASCPDSWQLLAAVDADKPDNVQRSGNLFIYRDKGLKPDMTNQYRLLALSRSGGISRPATTPEMRLHPVPLPPMVKAVTTPTAIRLELSPQGASPVPMGYNIYRRLAGTAGEPLPYNKAPVTGPTWEDQGVELGNRYLYSATSLVKADNGLAESLPSPEVEILFSLPEIR